MRVRVRLDNAGQALVDLQSSMQEFQTRAVAEDVHGFGFGVHRRAVEGIQRGPASGETYQMSDPSREHTASAPGEYPMSDTGRLASSVMVDTDKTSATIFSNLDYARYLELRAPERGGRPWLTRAFNEELASRGW